MGFVQPGKATRKRRHRSQAPNSASGLSHALKRQRLGLPAPPDPSPPPIHHPKQLTVAEPDEPAPSILERLPQELLYRIFVHVGPGTNNLPVVLRYFAQMFKFDPRPASTETGWRNLLLVALVIRQWYLFDANYLLDFEAVGAKIAGYLHMLARGRNLKASRAIALLITVLATWSREVVVLDDFLRLGVKSKHVLTWLEECPQMWLGPEARPVAGRDVASQFVDARYVSAAAMAPVAKLVALPRAMPVTVALMNEPALAQEAAHRQKFVELKFKEIAFYLGGVDDELTLAKLESTCEPGEVAVTDEDAVAEQAADTEARLAVLRPHRPFCELAHYKPMPAPYYVEENATVKYMPASQRDPCDLPETMYGEGVALADRLELLYPLYLTYNYRCYQADRMLVSLFSHYTRPGAFERLLPVHKVVEQVLFLMDLSDKRQHFVSVSSIDPLFRLVVRLGQWTSDDTVDAARRDVAAAIDRLLHMVYVHQQPQNNRVEYGSLWETVAELRHAELAELLFKYLKNPDVNIFHLFT